MATQSSVFLKALRHLDASGVARSLALDVRHAIRPPRQRGESPLFTLLAAGIPSDRFQPPPQAFDECLLQMMKALEALGDSYLRPALPVLLVKLTDAGCYRTLLRLSSLPCVRAVIESSAEQAMESTHAVNGFFLLDLALRIAACPSNRSLIGLAIDEAYMVSHYDHLSRTDAMQHRRRHGRLRPHRFKSRRSVLPSGVVSGQIDIDIDARKTRQTADGSLSSFPPFPEKSPCFPSDFP